MGSTQRYVVVGILAIAVVIAMALSQGTQWLWVQFSLDDPPIFGIRELPLSKVLAYGLVALAVVGVFKHAPTYLLANEIVEELTKVTWPQKEEIGNATVVVIIAVFICAAFLGTFDAFWLAVTNFVLGIESVDG